MTTTTEPRRDAEHDRHEPRPIDEETLRGFPPSSKLVLTVLDVEGPLTQKELAAETRLPQRTVRQATSRLEGRGIIERRVYVPDARQSRYALTAGLP